MEIFKITYQYLDSNKLLTADYIISFDDYKLDINSYHHIDVIREMTFGYCRIRQHDYRKIKDIKRLESAQTKRYIIKK